MADNHSLTLLDSEMEDICQVVLNMRVPTNWCDPILTGPTAALKGHGGTWGCPDIERLLNTIRGRVTPNTKVSSGDDH